MSISRKDALERLNGLSKRVKEHLRKIAESPGSQDVSHWRHEANNWIRQMVAVLFAVGKKTGAEWARRIGEWETTLGETNDPRSQA